MLQDVCPLQCAFTCYAHTSKRSSVFLKHALPRASAQLLGFLKDHSRECLVILLVPNVIKSNRKMLPYSLYF